MGQGQLYQVQQGQVPGPAPESQQPHGLVSSPKFLHQMVVQHWRRLPREVLGVTVLEELERSAAVALRDGHGLVVDKAVLG